MKRRTFTLLLAALLAVVVTSCDGEPAKNVSVNPSSGETQSTVSVDTQTDGSSETSSEEVSSDEVSSDEVSSEEVSSENTPSFQRSEILNVSTEKAGQVADLTLQEALSNYTITDNAGTLYVWQTTDNAAVRGLDVDLLVYEEEEDVLRNVVSFTLTNQHPSLEEFRKTLTFTCTHYRAEEKGLVWSCEFGLTVDLRGETPKVPAEDTGSSTGNEPAVNPVAYGEPLGIHDGVYDVWESHPEYGTAFVDCRGSYALYHFMTNVDFIGDITHTCCVYDYNTGKLTVLAQSGQTQTMGHDSDARFLDNDRVLVLNDSSELSVYVLSTGESIPVATAWAFEAYYSNAVSAYSIVQLYGDCLAWIEYSDVGTLRVLDLNTKKLKTPFEEEDISYLDVYGDTVLVRTKDLYSGEPGDVYRLDGTKKTLLAKDVRYLYRVGDRLYVERRVGDDQYRWETIAL